MCYFNTIPNILWSPRGLENLQLKEQTWLIGTVIGPTGITRNSKTANIWYWINNPQ